MPGRRIVELSMPSCCRQASRRTSATLASLLCLLLQEQFLEAEPCRPIDSFAAIYQIAVSGKHYVSRERTCVARFRASQLLRKVSVSDTCSKGIELNSECCLRNRCKLQKSFCHDSIKGLSNFHTNHHSTSAPSKIRLRSTSWPRQT